MADNQIDQIVTSAIEKIKSISNVSSVVGEAIVIDNITMLPISKLSVGFVAGGGEYGADKSELKLLKSYPFSGGSGGGVCLQPVGFLCIIGSSVKFIRVDGKTPLEKLIDNMPSIVANVAKMVVKGEKDEKN